MQIMESSALNADQRASAEGYVIRVMAVRLQEAGSDLNDMEVVRASLAKAGFGEKLIAHCADRAAEIAQILDAA